jgi:phage head maturation protease
MNIERRYTTGPARVGIEKRADGKPVIVGYASVFYRAGDPTTEYWLWPGEVVERIMPTAFDRAAKEDDVRGLFNHDPSEIWAATRPVRCGCRSMRSGFGTKSTRRIGPAGRVESIRRGDVTGSSFGFMPETTAFREEKRGDKRLRLSSERRSGCSTCRR